MDTNNGRPLPWHDTPLCGDGLCRGPMIPVASMANGYGGPRNSNIACAACGLGRVGTEEEVQRSQRAERACGMLDEGLIHDDRGCSRCNAPLAIDRQRLCESCIEEYVVERQFNLL